MKVRGVFPVGILLILLLGGSSSFAQKYKGDIAEYKVNELIYSEGYQQGISLEKTKTSTGKYFWNGSRVGFATTTLAIFPGIPSFFATPYLLKDSKIPEEDYQKAQSRGADYLESFQAGWEKET